MGFVLQVAFYFIIIIQQAFGCMQQGCELTHTQCQTVLDEDSQRVHAPGQVRSLNLDETLSNSVARALLVFHCRTPHMGLTPQ